MYFNFTRTLTVLSDFLNIKLLNLDAFQSVGDRANSLIAPQNLRALRIILIPAKRRQLLPNVYAASAPEIHTVISTDHSIFHFIFLLNFILFSQSGMPLAEWKVIVGCAAKGSLQGIIVRI